MFVVIFFLSSSSSSSWFLLSVPSFRNHLIPPVIFHSNIYCSVKNASSWHMKPISVLWKWCIKETKRVFEKITLEVMLVTRCGKSLVVYVRINSPEPVLYVLHTLQKNQCWHILFNSDIGAVATINVRAYRKQESWHNTSSISWNTSLNNIKDRSGGPKVHSRKMLGSTLSKDPQHNWDRSSWLSAKALQKLLFIPEFRSRHSRRQLTSI